MDNVSALQDRVTTLENKLRALTQYLGCDIMFTPESYTAVKSPTPQESAKPTQGVSYAR